MSVVAELTVAPDQFALGSALAAAPSVEVEFDRSVTHSQEWIMPFLWAEGDGLERFEAAIHDDPTVADAAVIDRFEDADRWMVRWGDGVRDMINDVFDQSGILTEAVGTHRRWRLVVHFVDYASLTDLEEFFRRDDTPLQLQRLYTPERPDGTEHDLTPEQYETLVAAAERGYFAVPRRATLDDVALQLGISSTAVSERLRRGLSTLVTNTLNVRRDVDDGAEGEASEPGT